MLFLAFASAAVGQEPHERPAVVHIVVDSIIHPVSATHVLDGLREAEQLEAAAVVIELSTPGGLSTSMDEIVSGILESRVPVIVYVSPTGSRAASAGFYILMAGDLAAMAPSTHTGAAAAIQGDGSDIEGKLGEKVEQDGLAQIRSLAKRNNRNQELAEAAVRDSRSYTADEALEGGLIDLIAEDLPSLLDEIDGREIRSTSDEPENLQTANAELTPYEMSTFQSFLAVIADPNIAYILMALGWLGLYFEFSNPGAILPGVVGAICMVLAFFALSVLPVNYAGIALILLAVIFFIAEIKVVSFGLLTVAGVISLVIGSLMLFKSADPAIRVSLDVILSAALFAAVVVGFVTFMVVKAHRQQVRTGSEGLLRERGVARSDLNPRGKVFVHGEIWDAESDVAVKSGDPIAVEAVEGLLLRVKGLAPSEPEPTASADAEV